MTGVGVGFNEIRLTTYLTSGGKAEGTKVGGTGAGHKPLVVRSLTGVGIYLVTLVPIYDILWDRIGRSLLAWGAAEIIQNVPVRTYTLVPPFVPFTFLSAPTPSPTPSSGRRREMDGGGLTRRLIALN